MSRQRFKINQLVQIALRSRALHLDGVGTVVKYVSGQRAGYRVRVLATGSAFITSYYRTPIYTKDIILKCMPSELREVTTWSAGECTHAVRMSSSIDKQLKDIINQKTNLAKNQHSWNNDYYTKNIALAKDKLMWINFSLKRLSKIENGLYKDKAHNMHIVADNNIAYPLERELGRTEYV